MHPGGGGYNPNDCMELEFGHAWNRHSNIEPGTLKVLLIEGKLTGVYGILFYLMSLTEEIFIRSGRK